MYVPWTNDLNSSFASRRAAMEPPSARLKYSGVTSELVARHLTSLSLEYGSPSIRCTVLCHSLYLVQRPVRCHLNAMPPTIRTLPAVHHVEDLATNDERSPLTDLFQRPYILLGHPDLLILGQRREVIPVSSGSISWHDHMLPTVTVRPLENSAIWDRRLGSTTEDIGAGSWLIPEGGDRIQIAHHFYLRACPLNLVWWGPYTQRWLYHLHVHDEGVHFVRCRPAIQVSVSCQTCGVIVRGV